MDCDYMKRGREYLRLDECGLKMMSGELEGSQTMSKIANKLRVSKRVDVPPCELRCVCFYNGALEKH